MIFPQRFVYHGHAFGLSGSLRRPSPHSSVEAAATLPSGGGNHEINQTGGANWKDVISCGTIRTFAKGGTPHLPDRHSQVSAEVEDLDVLGRLKIQRVFTCLNAHQPGDDDQPSITPGQVAITGVTIDGCPVDVILDTTAFVEGHTKDELRRKYEDDTWRQRHGGHFMHPSRASASPGMVGLPEYRWGYVFATLVKEIRVNHPDNCPKHKGGLMSGVVTVDHNMITVPDFGKVYFGEIVISERDRRLTGVRLQLGSPAEGDTEIAGTQSNGVGQP